MLFQIQTPDVDKLIEADSINRAKLIDSIDELTHMPLDDAIITVTNALIHLAMKVGVAFLILFIGRWIIRRIVKILNKIFERREVDLSLRGFLISLVKTILYIFLIITIIGLLGLDTTTFIAIFASAGLAIGMALSGTLQNFAGGVMILLIKPYRIGDYIETQDQAGTVKSIMLFHTVINTPDNKTIMIPNGGISTGIVNNYSTEPTRRLEWIFEIAYGEDYDKAKNLIYRILRSEDRIMRNIPYTIAINELAESSVKVVVRVWVRAGDYWNVFFNINEQVYKQFPANGIDFPFNQIDVRITNEKNLKQANDQAPPTPVGTGSRPVPTPNLSNDNSLQKLNDKDKQEIDKQ